MGLPLHVVVLLTWVGAMLRTGGASGDRGNPSLRPVQAIELPNVEGRIDHMAVDVKGQRLFVAALGNNTIEVIDLAAGRWVRSISPISNPQGVAFVPDGGGRLAAADGGDGICRIYDGKTFNPVAEIPGLGDADNIRYDAAAHRLYVGFGKNGRDGLAVIDPATGKKAAPDIPLDGHPESFRLEERGPRIFVNVPIATPKRGVNSGPNNGAHVAVVDRRAGKVVEKWPSAECAGEFPDVARRGGPALFIATRSSAALYVLDTDSGKSVATLPCVDDADDLFYDPAKRRGYVIGGAGSITVFDRRDGDRYEAAGSVKTAGGRGRGCSIPRREGCTWRSRVAASRRRRCGCSRRGRGIEAHAGATAAAERALDCATAQGPLSPAGQSTRTQQRSDRPALGRSPRSDRSSRRNALPRGGRYSFTSYSASITSSSFFLPSPAAPAPAVARSAAGAGPAAGAAPRRAPRRALYISSPSLWLACWRFSIVLLDRGRRRRS